MQRRKTQGLHGLRRRFAAEGEGEDFEFEYEGYMFRILEVKDRMIQSVLAVPKKETETEAED